jgi:LacI family transcriptional regulator, galactose operon repressor
MAVTLKNIAAICGVDISTVSRALRDDPKVQPLTRKKIQQQASELGYVPNLAARNLVSGKTLNLWMIIPDMELPVVREPACFLSKSLKRQGYDLLLTLYHHDSDNFKHKMSRLSQNVADGAFVIPGFDEEVKEVTALLRNNFPLVFIDRGMNIPQSTTVTTTNTRAAAELTEKCLEAGAEKFILFFQENNTAAEARLRGAIELLEARNIPFIVADNADAGTTDFIKDGRLAMLSSSAYAPGELSKKYGNAKLIVGVFDAWSGLTEKFSHIFVCKQDFKGIAEQAAKVMLRKINDKSHDNGFIEVPSLPLETLKSEYPVRK